MEDGKKILVLRVTGVSEAEALLWEKQPDLIISDITMEDGNGFDLCQSVRKVSDVHLIFLTALDVVRK